MFINCFKIVQKIKRFLILLNVYNVFTHYTFHERLVEKLLNLSLQGVNESEKKFLFLQCKLTRVFDLPLHKITNFLFFFDFGGFLSLQ